MNVCVRILTLILLLPSASSFADYYQAPMQQSAWELKRSKNSCRLKQMIPLYGSADFVQRSGENLQFSIQEQRHKPQVIKATLTAMPAPWMRGRADSADYQVYLDQPEDKNGYGRLSVYGEAAEAMIDALLRGQYPTFTYIRASSENNLEETRVEVSSIKFSDSYKVFSECRKNLLPAPEQYGLLPVASLKPHRFSGFSTAQTPSFSAEQGVPSVQNKPLFFNQGKIRLNEWAKQEVISIAEYMSMALGIKAVIRSATAIAGKTDQKLFAQRAGSIVEQLKKSGISAERIIVDSKSSAVARGVIIGIDVFGPDSIRFFQVNKGNTRLSVEDKQRLDLVVRYVLEYFNQGRVLISCHTDSRGSRASNQRATQQSADLFKHYLQSKGVASDRIQIKAYGEDKPVKSNRYPEGQAQNRRILIDFLV